MKKISWDSISKQKDPSEAESDQQLRAARSAAIRFIGIAAKSSGAVRDSLKRESYPDDVISEVIAALFEEGYLDDHRPARRIVRERTGARSESQNALRGRLARQGVSREVVEEVCADLKPDEESATDLVRSRFTRELQGFASLDHEERRRLVGKIGRFMQARGYSPRFVSKAVSTVLAEIGSEAEERIEPFMSDED